MIRLLLALAVALPALAEEEAPRLPLPVLGTDSVRHDDPRDLPIAVVGRAPEGAPPLPSLEARLHMLETTRYERDPETLPGEAVAKGLSEGTSSLRPAEAGAQVLVFLVGPALNSGETWGPTALSRAGNVLTLEVTGWRDNGPRRRNVPSKPTALVTLGELDPGDYEVRLAYRGFFLDVEKGQTRYELNSVETGALPFRVVAGPAAEGELPHLPRGAMKISTVERSVPRNKRPWAFVDEMDACTGKTPAPAVTAGAFDLERWIQAGEPTAPPELPAPGERDTICACVVGPQLNEQEWMSLREVISTDDGVILRVEVFRDSGERDHNVPYVPLLFATIDRPAKPSALRIDVEWIALRAKGPGGEYRLEHDQGLEPVHTEVELK